MNPDDKLSRLYANRFSDEERAARRRLWKILVDSVFARHIPPNATVIDVGAGTCDFINHVRAERRIAVDTRAGNGRFASEGVEFIHSSIESLGGRIEAGSADVVFASNVFEHLRSPDHLLDCLAVIRGLLTEGGLLIVLQPNVRLVGGRFWDFFDHTLPLTEKGLTEALVLSGFSIESVRARFLPYTTKSGLPQSPLLLRLYLALAPLQWIFGKQMLILARKAGP